MSIATEIKRLQDAKEMIQSAIIEKGVNVPDTEKLDEYPDYILQIEGGGPTPPTPVPEIEPYYVPGWFEHQDGNWVLVKAGQTWEIQYSDNGSSWTDASYTASDVDTWFNMDNEPFRQAKYVKRKNTTASTGDNRILAMNLDMPNYLSPAGYNSGSNARLYIWQDPSIINVKIKIDHFEVYLLTRSLNYCFNGNLQMTTCEITQYRPELMSATNMNNMFYNCSSLLSLDLSGWNVSNVTTMPYMFNNCSSLLSLDLSGWNVSNVTTMPNMFSNCYSLQSLDLSGWNMSNVTNTSSMFSNCYSLQSLDLSGWNVSNVTTMSNTFNGCYSLISLDLSGWNMSNVTSVGSMFNCNSLKDFKIKSKPKTQALTLTSTNNVLTNDSLQWMADNFPDISGDDTYTNKTISGFSSAVKSRYMWDYFYNTMTAKGYTIS